MFVCNYKPGYRLLIYREEESLDSIGQCTGEQPGLSRLVGREQTVPQKITALVRRSLGEGGLILSNREGDGENVG